MWSEVLAWLGFANFWVIGYLLVAVFCLFKGLPIDSETPPRLRLHNKILSCWGVLLWVFLDFSLLDFVGCVFLEFLLRIWLIGTLGLPHFQKSGRRHWSFFVLEELRQIESTKFPNTFQRYENHNFLIEISEISNCIQGQGRPFCSSHVVINMFVYTFVFSHINKSHKQQTPSTTSGSLGAWALHFAQARWSKERKGVRGGRYVCFFYIYLFVVSCCFIHVVSVFLCFPLFLLLIFWDGFYLLGWFCSVLLWFSLF